MGHGLRGVQPPGSVTCLLERIEAANDEGPLSTGVEHLLGSSPDCLESKLRHLFLSLSLTWEKVFRTGLEAAEDELSSEDVLSRMRLESPECFLRVEVVIFGLFISNTSEPDLCLLLEVTKTSGTA